MFSKLLTTFAVSLVVFSYRAEAFVLLGPGDAEGNPTKDWQNRGQNGAGALATISPVILVRLSIRWSFIAGMFQSSLTPTMSRFDVTSARTACAPSMKFFKF